MKLAPSRSLLVEMQRVRERYRVQRGGCPDGKFQRGSDDRAADANAIAAGVRDLEVDRIDRIGAPVAPLQTDDASGKDDAAHILDGELDAADRCRAHQIGAHRLTDLVADLADADVAGCRLRGCGEAGEDGDSDSEAAERAVPSDHRVLTVRVERGFGAAPHPSLLGAWRAKISRRNFNGVRGSTDSQNPVCYR